MSRLPDSFDAMIESKYLKKEDFPERKVLTIAGFSHENVAQENDPPEFKWLLRFEGLSKPFVLNSTNIQILKQAYGGPNQAIGQKVMVYVDPNVSFGGKLVGGLRLRGPSRTAPEPQTQPAMKNVDDFADDIPF